MTEIPKQVWSQKLRLADMLERFTNDPNANVAAELLKEIWELTDVLPHDELIQEAEDKVEHYPANLSKRERKRYHTEMRAIALCLREGLPYECLGQMISVVEEQEKARNP